MKNFENTFEISQEVKERLNIVPIDYDKYCNKLRKVGVLYRINGYVIYVKKVEISELFVYVHMTLNYKSSAYDIVVGLDNNENITIKANFDNDELKTDDDLQNALEHLLDLHVPKKFWEIKAMLN